MNTLTPPEAHFFLNDLRKARLATLGDSENATELLTAFERLGYHCTRPDRPGSLRRYRSALLELTGRSGLEQGYERDPAGCATSDLFDSIVRGRNEIMHVGVSARRLATHAVLFALFLERGLMSDLHLVKHFMVPHPIVAEPWQTVAHVRQTMLLHQFSYLPFRDADGNWKLIADHALAGFLRDPAHRTDRMTNTLAELVPTKQLELISARTTRAWSPIDVLLKEPSATPWLVLDDAGEELRGIVTAFDLL